MDPTRSLGDATATPGGVASHRVDYLLVIDGDRSWTMHLPPSGEVVIGRDPAVGLVLGDALVSRSHAQLLVVPDGLRLTDLGSRHGTLVNGERLDGPRLLASGDVVTIGQAVVIVRSRAVTTRTVVDSPGWLARLVDETERARQFQRELAVVVVKVPGRGADALLLAAGAVRAIDAVALLGDALVGVILPEAGVDEAIAVAGAIRRAAGAVAAGVAVCPDDGVDADALVASARGAAAGAEPGHTVLARDATSPLTIGRHRVVAVDSAMRRLFELAERLARSGLPILIQGETGCGKEVAATAIHVWSSRADRPFVSINCAAIAETLAESELFGHARGAFSGAVGDRVGHVEAAAGGTLFLDEIGELTPPVQAKLLRVLETGEVTRVGEVTPRHVDLRVVAATNRDLEAEVAAGRFRRDLYFRLGAARVTLPALRDRPRDLGALARALLADAAGPRRPREFSVEAMHTLHRHTWPGNVRELRNAVDYAAAAASDDAPVIERWHLPEPLASIGKGEPVASAAAAATAVTPGFRPIADEVRELERARMVAALRATGGVQNRAADLIEMPQRTFATKLKRYRISEADWGTP